jgi:hypothetical protein
MKRLGEDSMLTRALNGIGIGLIRRTWFVVVVTVIACAAFSARAVAALVEATYLAPAPSNALPPPVAKTVP